MHTRHMLTLAVVATLHAQTFEKRTLSAAGAQRVLSAAADQAHELATTGAIAVVDDGGNLMALERLDGTFAAGAPIAIGKARTAALFQKHPHNFAWGDEDGRTLCIAARSGLYRMHLKIEGVRP